MIPPPPHPGEGPSTRPAARHLFDLEEPRRLVTLGRSPYTSALYVKRTRSGARYQRCARESRALGHGAPRDMSAWLDVPVIGYA